MNTKKCFAVSVVTFITYLSHLCEFLSCAPGTYKQNSSSLTRHNYLFILVILLCVGCASQSINVREPVSVKLSNYSTLLVDVSSNNTEYFSEARNQLETLLISKLRKKDLFEKVISTTTSERETADLQLSITIVDLYKVTRSNRLFWGYIIGGCVGRPGSAKIHVAVKLVETDTKKMIGDCEVVGKSSHHSTFAGTTKQAIKRAVDQIVEYIHNNI